MIDEDRLKHSLVVARKMVEIGKIYKMSEKQIQELFILGINHDIGYEFGDNSNHNEIGGDILNMADMQINKYMEIQVLE